MLENWRRSARAIFSISTTCRSPTKANSSTGKASSACRRRTICVLPHFERTPDDAFLRKIDASGKKWVIVTNPTGEPVFVLDSHQFLRDALFDELEANPNNYWHRPIVVRDMKTKLGDGIGHMKVVPEHPDDDVIDNDLILVWGDQKRIITGADLLGRLLRGIVAVDGAGTTRQPADRGAQSGAIAAGRTAPSMWSSS